MIFTKKNDEDFEKIGANSQGIYLGQSISDIVINERLELDEINFDIITFQGRIFCLQSIDGLYQFELFESLETVEYNGKTFVILKASQYKTDDKRTFISNHYYLTAPDLCDNLMLDKDGFTYRMSAIVYTFDSLWKLANIQKSN